MVLNKFYFKEANEGSKVTHIFLFQKLQEINFTLKNKTETIHNRKG